MHVALSWSEPGGLALYLDGKPAGTVPGPLDLDARLDQFGLLCQAVTPHHTAPTENPGTISEVRVYGAALGAAEVVRLADRRDVAVPRPEPPDMARRLGWNDAARVPAGDAFVVKRIPVVVARDVRKFCLKGLDGKRETIWPVFSHGYADEGKAYHIEPAAQPMNLLRTTGNLRGRVTASSGVDFVRTGAGEPHYHALAQPISEQWVHIDRQSGFLGDIEFLRVEKRAGPGNGPWVRFGPADRRGFEDRRASGTYAVWKPGATAAAAEAPYQSLLRHACAERRLARRREGSSVVDSRRVLLLLRQGPGCGRTGVD